MSKYIRGKVKDHNEPIILIIDLSIKYSVFRSLFTEVISMGEFNIRVDEEGKIHMKVYSRDNNGNTSTQDVIDEDVKLIEKLVKDMMDT